MLKETRNMDPSLPALERTDHSHTRAGRPRDRAARAAILQAANALLEENGIAGFGMEAVAARAGVGKSTIYRWWPSKGALAMAGFLAATEPKISYPKDGDSALDALRRQLLRVAEVYAGPTGRVMAAILAEGQRDPHTITAFVEGYARPRRDEARTILQAAITQGELRPDLDPEVVLDALYGPIYYRMLVPVGPLDIKWMDTLVQTVLDGIALPRL
ncbi:transcriptional regulator [Komagataeibacter saccharivorans NRIC 0614]|nr:transcriptional regulator [Komagataeibacter saccharivorans NRIC 0614]